MYNTVEKWNAGGKVAYYEALFLDDDEFDLENWLEWIEYAVNGGVSDSELADLKVQIESKGYRTEDFRHG